jgi:outer membrane protein assembly factor BamB
MGPFSSSSPRSLALLGAAAAIAALAGLPLSGAAAATSVGWSTYLNTWGRTGYNAAETVITPSTAPKLTTLWDDKAGGSPSSISAEPIEVNGVVYYGSWDGDESAVNATTGTALWSADLGQTTDSDCVPPTVGVASTPTVATITVHGAATRALFVGGGNGYFYALNASTGAVIWRTQLGAPPDYFLWSSPLLYKGSIYEGISSFGDCPLIRGGIVRMNAATGAVQDTLYTVPAGCAGASVWGSPTVDGATGDIYFATGNGGSCASTETLAVAVVQTDSSLNVLSSWQVPAAQHGADSDFGSTPTLFSASVSGVVEKMVGIQNKNGTYYAFNRASLSGGPVWQDQIADGGDCPQCGTGADISPSAYDGKHLFVAGEKTTISGTACAGSIRALKPGTGAALWADCLQSPVLGAVTAVPGVVFVGAGETVYALDASTGATLWSYEDSASGSDFWGAMTIANGVVYAGNQDGNLYAFDT